MSSRYVPLLLTAICSLVGGEAFAPALRSQAEAALSRSRPGGRIIPMPGLALSDSLGRGLTGQWKVKSVADTLDRWCIRSPDSCYHALLDGVKTKSGRVWFVLLVSDSGSLAGLEILKTTGDRNAVLKNQRWNSLSPDRHRRPPFRIGNGIDAVTGSTLSVTAVVSAVNRDIALLTAAQTDGTCTVSR